MKSYAVPPLRIKSVLDYARNKGNQDPVVMDRWIKDTTISDRSIEEEEEGIPPWPMEIVAHLGGKTVDLKAAYDRIMHCDFLRSRYYTARDKHDWIVENWNPSEYLSNSPRNINPTYETTNWWRAESVILPWVVSGDRYIAVHVWMRAKHILVMDPLYFNLDPAGKLSVKKDLGPLIVLMAYWLTVGGYYEHNVYKIPQPEPEDMGFQLVFRKPENLITSPHPWCSAVVTCLNVERVFSESPSIQAATNNCCKYKKLYACRIFGYSDV